MLDLIESYYEPLRGTLFTQFYEPGQFFEAPVLYLQTESPALAVSGHYEEESSGYQYSIARVSFDDMRDPAEPIQPLSIRSNERGFITKAKLRPAILLSTAPSVWREGGRRSDEAFVVAPVYSFQGDPTAKKPYSAAFVERVKAYFYNSFFYLPSNNKPAFNEGFARFDRLQVIHKNWLRHRPLKLTADALNCLQAWLFAYLARDRSDVVEANAWLDLISDYRDTRMGS